MKKYLRTYALTGRHLVKRLLPVVLSLAFCGMSGCGYHFPAGHHSMLFLDRKVAVPLFGNAALRPNLETIFTAALRDVIVQRGGATASADTADMLLTGRVVSYSSTAISYTADDRIREYRAAMTVEATLRARQGDAVSWRGVLTLDQDYPAVELPLNNPAISERFTPANRIALQQNSEDAAVRELSRKMAEQLYDRMTGDF